LGVLSCGGQPVPILDHDVNLEVIILGGGCGMTHNRNPPSGADQQKDPWGYLHEQGDELGDETGSGSRENHPR